MILSIPDFSGACVLVAGDVMLDRYLFGGTERISPEAPVPVVQVRETVNRAGGAAKVAAIGPVRDGLLAFQRNCAAAPPGGACGAVLDGRDIGTVVCPDADVKLFVTADIAVRAERRHKELLDRGKPSIYARVLQGLTDRDARDRNRSAAPLVAARDAIELDTSAMTPDEAFDTALAIIETRVVGS